MIRSCTDHDLRDIFDVINDAAMAYRSVIPAEHWQDTYMPIDALTREIGGGVRFWGFMLNQQLVGVIGMQDRTDATLIRHAYVRTEYRNQGIGGQLLAELRAHSRFPLMVGTWAAARWAIAFYRKHGFHQVSPTAGQKLLRKYWTVSPAQMKSSVVLVEADPAQFEK
ncbi:MAG: GNAT family N-acetyltransferase [Betaproteobacteria bacterium]